MKSVIGFFAQIWNARLVFYAIAMLWGISTFIVDYSRPAYVAGYLIMIVGILCMLAGWWELRAAQRRAEAAMREYVRVLEVEYLEWLHNASPDD